MEAKQHNKSLTDTSLSDDEFDRLLEHPECPLKKYICTNPGCGAWVWAQPNALIICGGCFSTREQIEAQRGSPTEPEDISEAEAEYVSQTAHLMYPEE